MLFKHGLSSSAGNHLVIKIVSVGVFESALVRKYSFINIVIPNHIPYSA